MQTLLLFLATLVAQNPWPPPGMSCPQRTLVMFDEGPNSDKGPQLFQQHVSYLLDQMKSGKIISAGPMAAGHSALIIFATKDWDEIQNILQSEPYTQAGVIKIAHHDLWNACEIAK